MNYALPFPPAVSELQLAELMVAHETALVNVSLDAVEVSLSGVLPKGDVPIVDEYRQTLRVLSNHQQVSVELSCEVLVVEVRSGVDERSLTIFVLHHLKELEQRVAELLRAKSSRCFYVDHRYKVLLAWLTLHQHIFHLRLLVRLRTIEVV